MIVRICFYIAEPEMYIPKPATYIPKPAIYIPKPAMKNFIRIKVIFYVSFYNLPNMKNAKQAQSLGSSPRTTPHFLPFLS